MKGTITVIKQAKGYGFITGTDGVTRFFHANDQQISSGDPHFNTLREQQHVEFEVTPAEEAPKGPRARRIRIAS